MLLLPLSWIFFFFLVLTYRIFKFIYLFLKKSFNKEITNKKDKSKIEYGLKENEKLLSSFKYTSADIPKELLEKMSIILNSKLYYPCPLFIKYFVFSSLNSRDIINNKKIDCQRIQFFWNYYKIDDLGMPFFKVHVEKHYGKPNWDGKEMHYNYKILRTDYVISENNIDAFWKSMEDEFLPISQN